MTRYSPEDPMERFQLVWPASLARRVLRVVRASSEAESVAGWLRQAALEKMARDGEPAPDDPEAGFAVTRPSHIRNGQRTYIRAHFACEPDGCGAQPGEACRAYIARPGKTTGTPTPDVHAARWRAYHDHFTSRRS